MSDPNDDDLVSRLSAYLQGYRSLPRTQRQESPGTRRARTPLVRRVVEFGAAGAVVLAFAGVMIVAFAVGHVRPNGGQNGAQASSPAVAAASTPTATTPVTPSPTTGAGYDKTPVLLTEAQNGLTVTATRGQTILLTLHSTYWMIGGSSDTAVLKARNDPSVQPSPGCIAGAGCGTVIASYTAVGDGEAALGATRFTCGEALRCTGGAGSFSVTVVIRG
jgi:hypothetical protein